MTFPAITAFYAAILALIYVGLSGWVVGGRVTSDTLHGTGDADYLEKRIRVHGNFVEYVPFAIILIAFLEAGGSSPTFVRVLLLVLILARILHPFGMFAAKNSPQQFACRGGGTIATYGVIVVAALALLLR